MLCSPLIAHYLCCMCSLRRLKCHGESLFKTSLDLRTPDDVALTSKFLTVSQAIYHAKVVCCVPASGTTSSGT